MSKCEPSPSDKRERAAFEDAAFNQRFFSSIVRTKPGEFGPVGISHMPKDCPTKADFLAKREDGSYTDDTLNAAWWAWQERGKQTLSSVSAEHDTVPREDYLRRHDDAVRRWEALGNIKLMVKRLNPEAGQAGAFAEIIALCTRAMMPAPHPDFAPSSERSSDERDAARWRKFNEVAKKHWNYDQGAITFYLPRRGAGFQSFEETVDERVDPAPSARDIETRIEINYVAAKEGIYKPGYYWIDDETHAEGGPFTTEREARADAHRVLCGVSHERSSVDENGLLPCPCCGSKAAFEKVSHDPFDNNYG